MKDSLIAVLESFGYPVFQHGSLNEDDDYPDSFFTFWNNETYNDHFYDNSENYTVWDFDVNFYSTDPVLVDEMLVRAGEKLKESDFIVRGEGYDVASDEITHTGRGMNVLKIEL